MDPRFLKMMGEAMSKFMAGADSVPMPGPAGFLAGLKDFGLTPPLGPAEAEKFQREWLAFFGAVPKKDFEELEKKAAALSAEVEALHKTLEGMAAAMAGLAEMPESVKPWVKLINEGVGRQMEWFAELQKRMKPPDPDRNK